MSLKLAELPVVNFTIINWEALPFMPQLRNVQWDWIIADEAHKIKDRKAKRSKYLKMIPVRRKIALTGTPFGNHPGELWSILNWMYPKVFTSYWKFYENFVEYLTKWGGYHDIIGAKNPNELKRLLSKIMIRRRVDEVLEGIERPIVTVIPVDLSTTERRAYSQMAKKIKSIKGKIIPAKTFIGENEDELLEANQVLVQLTRLRQFAGAYAEFDETTGKVKLREPSAKLDAVMEILENTDKPVVVFSMHRGMIDLLMHRLEKAKIPAGDYTGKTPQVMRSANVQGLQSGRLRVLGATIQAAGLGLDGLQVADTFIFLDRSWSPIDNSQAEGRSRFHLQLLPVNFIHIRANHTVDQYVDITVQNKKSWFNQVIEGTL
jgi:SNF2 family DNA or RNA helicase